MYTEKGRELMRKALRGHIERETGQLPGLLRTALRHDVHGVVSDITSLPRQLSSGAKLVNDEGKLVWLTGYSVLGGGDALV